MVDRRFIVESLRSALLGELLDCGSLVRDGLINGAVRFGRVGISDSRNVSVRVRGGEEK